MLRRLGVAGAVVVAVLVAATPAASAHAVLLRTDPSPQTTVKSAPSSVKLVYSEPVEATFGAVRVFDVDARRVDTGSISRAQGSHEVVVPVQTLKDGTYTVTWRVVSADGHPVHGGFTFYVGAPSTISAKQIAEDKGAGRVVGWGFGVVRFLWFGALLGLIGAAVVRLWVWTPSVRRLGLSDSDIAEAFRRRFARTFPMLWAVLLVTGALTLVFQTASISGFSLWRSFQPSALSSTLDTAYGHYWKWTMAITVVLLLPVIALIRRRLLWGVSPRLWLALFGVGAAGMCATAALNSHARTLGHAPLGVTSVAVHLAAVSVWVGGLGALVLLAGIGWRTIVAEERSGLLRALVPRFSRLAVVAVAVLIATGVVNSIVDLAHVSDLWRTTYGRVILAKIGALVVALVLAARHLWVTPKRLDDAPGADSETHTFTWTSRFELVVLAFGVALASALVALVPGKTLAIAANGPVNLQRQAGQYTVQLFVDQTAVPNQVHVTFVNAQGLAAAEVTNVNVSVARGDSAPTPLDMRLLSAGHFVADTPSLATGTYKVTVTAAGTAQGSTTFAIRLKGRGDQ